MCSSSLRFSHSPLIDEDDDEEEAKEPMLNEAFGKDEITSPSRTAACDRKSIFLIFTSF
jgi:hypothetical protein